MADLDLAAIRARAEAATEGPWENDYPEVGQHWSRPEPWAKVVSTDVACMAYCYGGSAQGIENEADAEFIAHAREDIPALLAEIDRLNATIQRVREIERRMDEYAHRSGPCTGVNCGGCQAGRFSTALRRALEGGELKP